MNKHTQRSLFDFSIAIPAAVESFRKLNPLHQIKNPVMFVVLVGADHGFVGAGIDK
jgi:K+-transporting ATPase ATPase B chain